MATRSLQAHQRSLEVNGQNIANVDTPGYHRQVSVLRSVSGPGAVVLDRAGSPVAPGGGVDVARVHRVYASWLDQSAATLGRQAGQSSVRQHYAGEVERLLAEPTDAGLQATMDRFFASWGHLADRPDESTARVGVGRAGTEVAIRFQQLTQGLADLATDVVGQARDNVTAINRLAGQVAELGRTIGLAQSTGASPNELLDERDQLLDELIRRAGVQVSGRDTADVVVSLGGATLVQGQKYEALELVTGTTLGVAVKSTGQMVSETGGELRAQQDWVNTLLPGYQARVTALRDQFATAVNTLHQSGKDLTGAPGEPFYQADPGGNLLVNPALLADVRKLVAGDGTAGDGRIALAIAGLRTDGSSVVATYQSLVGDIGTEANNSRRLAEQTVASLHQVQALQASESGVNLDEELAQMVSLQQTYAASARMLAAFDEMLTTLIQRTGV